MQPQQDESLSSNFSILIVEDDLPFAIELEMLVEELGYQVKGCIDNSAEALEMILLQPPDLILMDINIKGRQTGLEIAEQIKDKEVPILFISSIKEKATYERSQTTNFIGYLVKPISQYSLKTAIDLAVKSIAGKQKIIESEIETYAKKDFLYYKKKGVFHKIAIATILYIKSDRYQTTTFTENQQFTSFISLKAFLELLAPYDFMQVHRSYIVNLLRVTSIDVTNQYIHLNEFKVPFSRRMKKEILLRLSVE